MNTQADPGLRPAAAALAGFRGLQRRIRGWTLASCFTALVFALPTLVILGFIFAPADAIWQHLAETVLQDYVVNSVLLTLGVAVFSLVIGTATAWLTSMCEFNGRRILQWALLLPLAAPAYIVAFTYTGLLDPAGSVQTAIRTATGLAYGEYWFPEIRSLPGAMLILGLVLYPYVYMLSRAAFLEQSVCVLEVSRSLGCGAWRTFLRVALPLARPGIVAGLALVAMETLADYGSVQYLGVSTFTTGIFRTWFGLNHVPAAAQLSAMLLGFIGLLLWLERLSRRGARYHHTSGKYSRLPRYRLKGWRNAAAVALCALPLLFGFIIPVTQLAIWTVQNYSGSADPAFYKLIWNSLWLAAIAAIAAVVIALFLGYAQRLNPSAPLRAAVRTAALGYAVPGTVIALGVMIIAGWTDQRLHSQNNWGWLLSGSFTALIFTYLVRFLSVSLQSIEAGLGKIKPGMDDAARALGHKPLQVLTGVHLPVLRGTLLTALLLVFVDVLKELPATLVLRPFNFNTLAVRAYELAIDERLTEAASAGLAIVFAGIIPVIVLSRSINRARPGQRVNQNITATETQTGHGAA
jgi:iron(III) transport system permease protein